MDRDIKDRVVETTAILYCNNGIKSVTMDMVAAEAGISKRTLYEYFSDKDSLVLAVVQYLNSVRDREIEAAIKGANNSLEEILLAFRKILSIMQMVNRNYITDLKRYHHKVADILKKDKLDKMKYMETEFITRGVKEGLILPNLNIDIIVLFLESQGEYIVNSQEAITGKYTIMDIYKTVFINFIRGISTTKGIEIIDNFIKENNINN